MCIFLGWWWWWWWCLVRPSFLSGSRLPCSNHITRRRLQSHNRWPRTEAEKEVDKDAKLGMPKGKSGVVMGGDPCFCVCQSRWWFQRCFLCSSRNLGKWFQFWRSCFWDGWFNHQLVWQWFYQKKRCFWMLHVFFGGGLVVDRKGLFSRNSRF